MYRIELSPGEETAFRSIEELAVAIRRNVVTSRARIYHNATMKWLPIQFHPHYKIAVSMPLTQADLVAGPPVAPLSSLKLGDAQTASPPPSTSAATQAALAAWPAPKPVSPPPARQDPPPPPVHRAPPPPPKAVVSSQPPIMLGTPAPEPRRAVQPARVVEPVRMEPVRMEPARVVEPARSAPTPAKSSRKRRKNGRTLRIGLAGAVLAACAHLVISAAGGSSALAARVGTPRRLIEIPTEIMKEDSPRTVAGVLPGLQTIPLPRQMAASIKRTPRPVVPPPAARASTPAPTVDSAATPEIHPAPEASDMSAGTPGSPVSVIPQGVDSTGKKALNRILRTIGGTPAPERATPRR
jgi:hypothetical protein